MPPPPPRPPPLPINLKLANKWVHDQFPRKKLKQQNRKAIRQVVKALHRVHVTNGWKWAIKEPKLGGSFSRSTATAHDFDVDIVVKIHKLKAGEFDALFEKKEFQEFTKRWLEGNYHARVVIDEKHKRYVSFTYRVEDVRADVDLLFMEDGSAEDVAGQAREAALKAALNCSATGAAHRDVTAEARRDRARLSSLTRATVVGLKAWRKMQRVGYYFPSVFLEVIAIDTARQLWSERVGGRRGKMKLKAGEVVWSCLKRLSEPSTLKASVSGAEPPSTVDGPWLEDPGNDDAAASLTDTANTYGRDVAWDELRDCALAELGRRAGGE